VNSLDHAERLQRRLALPSVAYFDEIGSTLDAAHELAEQGAPAGTLVLAGAQTAGRGRMGRTWRSEPGAGLWLTIIERPTDASAIDVLSLRIGLALAPALEAFASAPGSLL
jgi:BirA family biotin operon repressor/biotin-[acetyl-CoA-carboxylase] ligase